MAADSYTVRVAPEAAGMVVRGSAATLESSLATTAMYEHDGTYIMLSNKGKVRVVAATERNANATSRVFVGIRNHDSKTVTLLPAAGEQVVRLRPRLSDRTYDAPSRFDDSSLADRSKRIRRTTELVQQFGSTRRVKQMGQREAARSLEGHVANRDDMEAAVKDLGNRAQASGLTTAQVMAKISAERSIPAHDPEATNAEDAYQIHSIVSSADLRHMHVSTFNAALQSPDALAALRSQSLWKALDPFVRYMLHIKQREGLPEHKQEECSQWLALYHVCRKMLLVRPGVVLDEAAAPLEGSAEDGVAEEEDDDPFAARGARVLNIQGFAAKCGFVSQASVVHFAQRFGNLEAHEQGMKFRMSDKEAQLLRTTLAVCVVRCNTNRITLEIGRVLLKALKPTASTDVTNWLKEIGCKVTAVRQYPEGAAFTAALLTAYKKIIPLSESLPKIKPRGRKKKA